jgi:hypothetical protein
MKTVSKSITFFLLACNTSVISNAQLFSKYELGINAGSFIYQGDLTPSAFGSFKTPAFVVGLNGSRYLTNKTAIRLDVNFGKLKGDDAAYDKPGWRQERNFAFKTPVTEIIGSVVYNVSGREKKFSPYFFAGLGYSILRIKREYSNFNSEYFAVEPSTIQGLESDINHRLPRGLPIMPIAFGLKYRLTNSFILSTEASYRYISSDYLDGFSQSANPGKKDHYYKFSLGLIYSPFKKNSSLDCPRF